MSTESQPEVELPQRSARGPVIATVVFLAITVAAVTWSKWWPYAHKVVGVAADHTLGRSVLDGESGTPPPPSWSAAVDYALGYFDSIWIALVAGLLIAAGVEALLPKRWLLRALEAGPKWLGGTFTAGMASMPTMMCTCCTAPVAVSMRRRGASAPAALAYWVGNPTLNPAVLIFMALILPWQWVAVRGVAGVFVVFAVTALVGRLAGSRTTAGEVLEADDAPVRAGSAARRFVTVLARLAIILIPEYVVIVLALGAFRGWLFPAASGLEQWALLAVPLLAITGALFVIPTAAEIPIIVGLLATGVGAGTAGALLITLPALSLPSLLMISREFPRKVLAALTASVVGIGILGSGALVLLGA